jgi:hypothetical protein
VRRRLYTDDDLKVFAFRRVVWLTSIDLIGVRDDLADRAVTISLHALGRRRLDEEIARAWAEAHPRLLGALLDLAVRVLAELPTVSTDDLPRMADFACVLLAVDRVRDTAGTARYRQLAADLAVDLAATDPVLEAIAQDIKQPFTGTSADLLAKLDDGRWLDRLRPKSWPTSARELSSHLTRSAPTLRQLGWTVTCARGGKNHQLRWTIAPAAGGGLAV